MKSGTLLSQVASRTMPHEVKSTHALHSHYKYKHLSWGKYDEEEKMPNLRLGNVFQKVDSKWDESYHFLRSPLRAN